MLMRSHKLAIISLSSFLIYSTLGAEIPTSGPQTNGLRCLLQCDRTEIRAGSPILLFARLVNASGRTFHLSGPFGEGYSTLSILVRKPKASSWAKLNPQYIACVFVEGGSVPLEPGRSFGEYTLVLCRNDSFVFDEVGKYEFKVEVRLKEGMIASPPIIITVSPPTPQVSDWIYRLGKIINPEKESPDPEVERVRKAVGPLGVGSGMNESTITLIKQKLGELNEYQPLFSIGEAVNKLENRKAEDRQAAFAKLQQVRDNGNALWKEIAIGIQAYYHAKAREHGKAEELISKAKNPSQWSNLVKAVIEDHASELDSRVAKPAQSRTETQPERNEQEQKINIVVPPGK